LPEGDSVAGHAARLRPVLAGRTITEVGGTASSLRANSHRVLGATVEEIRTLGKNLVIDLSGGYSIRVHLGMSGRWLVLSRGRPTPGAARLVLSTDDATAVCLAAPTVEVARTPGIDHELSRLGPDVLDDFDVGEFVRRARSTPSVAMSELLLDQRVIAGIGNVYKSELLFLAGIDPRASVDAVTDEQLSGIAAYAVRLMRANVGPKSRTTTGSRARGREMWVYGRQGRPCRRCGSGIAMDRQGDRVTYWCPGCQEP
jgi:endonuclease-8